MQCVLERADTSINKGPVTPNSDATAFVQRSKSMSTRCGIATEYALKYQICQLKRVHNILIASLHRQHNVPTATLQRP